jgi:DNA invertase Pin-like site-specific DNA recombinase
MLGHLGPGDVVTVTRIDRLVRNTFDLFAIVKQIVDAKAQFRLQAEPWTDTGTSTGRLMIAVLGGLADVERDLIRTPDSRRQKPRQGPRKAHGPTLRANRKRPSGGVRRARRCRNWQTATSAAYPPCAARRGPHEARL